MEVLLVVLLVFVVMGTAFRISLPTSPIPQSLLDENEAVVEENRRWLVKRTLSLEPTKSGLQIPRAVLALFLAEPELFDPRKKDNVIGEGLKKKLWLHMNMRASYFQSRLRGYYYALYVLASISTCVPVVSLDVVRQLWNRVDGNAKTLRSFELLALCYAGNGTERDVERAMNATDDSARTDNMAMATLAMQCLSGQFPELKAAVIFMQELLKQRQSSNGTVGDIATTALVVQALKFNLNFRGFDLPSAWDALVKAQKARRGRTVRDALYIFPLIAKQDFRNFFKGYCNQKGIQKESEKMASSVDMFRLREGTREEDVVLPKGVLLMFLEIPSYLDADSEQARKLRWSLFKMPVEVSSDIATRYEELAVYVQALLVVCEDPRYFFGRDLVSELRERMDASPPFANPFEILALCNAEGNVTTRDVERVSAAFNSRPISLNTRAMATIAMQCLSLRGVPGAEEGKIRTMQEKLKEQKIKNKTRDDRVTTALVLQALRFNFNFDGFDLNRALKTLTPDSWEGDIDRAFYILPAVYGKSFLDFNSKHCPETRISVNRFSSPEDLLPRFVYIGKQKEGPSRWELYSRVAALNSIRNLAEADTYLSEIGRENIVESEKPSYFGQRSPFCFVLRSTKYEVVEMFVFWLEGNQTMKLPALEKTGPGYNEMNPLEKFHLWYEGNFKHNDSCISVWEDDKVGFWYSYGHCIPDPFSCAD